ncbi:hypothetical protein KCP74_11275 [Salmonella enterica subsp. enterica]|nr:hypothetical protein KCP74_11275 [Salmonella enterica subsp. enterica]
MVSTLITVAAYRRCAQLALGGWQILFYRASINLANRGGSASGAPGGRFKSRVVAAVALDEQQRVTAALY